MCQSLCDTAAGFSRFTIGPGALEQKFIFKLKKILYSVVYLDNQKKNQKRNYNGSLLSCQSKPLLSFWNIPLILKILPVYKTKSDNAISSALLPTYFIDHFMNILPLHYIVFKNDFNKYVICYLK